MSLGGGANPARRRAARAATERARTHWTVTSVKASAEVPAWAGRELRAMGSVSRREIAMAALAVLALSLWIAHQQ